MSMSAAQLCPNDDVLEVRAIYRDVVLGTRYLTAPRRRQSRRKRRHNAYRIGVGRRIDAPVAAAFLPADDHLLVDAQDGSPVINVTPQMNGEIVADGQTWALASFVEEHGRRFGLPADARATVRCGEMTFLLAHTSAAQRVQPPAFVWRAAEMIYPTGTAAVLGLLLLMIFAVPQDQNALSLDQLGVEHHLIKFRIKPPEAIPVAAEQKAGLARSGAAGRPSAGEQGQMGDAASRDRDRRYAIKGPHDNPDPHLAKQRAIQAARRSGILGVLARTDGALLASIFGEEAALGRETEDVLGSLVGTQIGDAYGISGLHLLGTGSGGADTGKGTIGDHRLNTIGLRGGIGDGEQVASRLDPRLRRRAIVPAPIDGIGTVRGGLDKEIVRRIVRRHLNEVKYCYEQELARAPHLAGRVVVAFTIAANGRVLTSALGSSTLGNARVESCAVQAVRRWEFPTPMGGGLVMVSYPFMLSPAGAE